MKRLTTAVAVLAFLIPAAAFAEKQPLALTSFDSQNVDAAVAENLEEAAFDALHDLKVFEVSSPKSIRQRLNFDKSTRALTNQSCADSDCLAQLGKALEARYLVGGSVIGLDKVKGPFTVTMKLFDTARNTVAESQSRSDLKTFNEAKDAAALLAVAVVRPLLDKEQGFLVVSSAEAGATVSIDGRAVGTTPLPLQRLGRGPHRVVVEKKEFIAWAKDVQIEKDKATSEQVSLIPSPDYMESYRSHNRLMRIGAWTTTALAVVGVGAAGYLQFAKVNPTSDKFTPLGEAWKNNASGAQSDKLDSVCADAASQDASAGIIGEDGKVNRDACYSYAETLSKQGTNYVNYARISVGVGVVAAAAATYFWLAGEDPSRYDAFIESAPASGGDAPAPAAPAAAPAPEKHAVKASGGIVPITGGGMATFALTF